MGLLLERQADIGKLTRRPVLVGSATSGVLNSLPALARAKISKAAPIFGAYTGYAGRYANGARSYAHTQAMLGKPIGALLAFGDTSAWGGWGDGTGSISGTMESSAAYNLSQLAGSGKQLIWSQPLAMGYNAYSVFGYGSDSHPKSGLQDVTGGAFDPTFLYIAKQLVKYGFANAVIRPGWEFNLAAFPWGNPWADPSAHAVAYVAAFRHVTRIMRSAPGNSFKFLWCPNKGKPDQPSPNPVLAYPGDDVVDYVGMDVYDDDLNWVNPQGYGSNAAETPAQRWQTSCLGAASDYRLNWLAAFATNASKRPMAAGVQPAGRKPIIIGEWGAGGPTSLQDPPNDTYARARAYAGGDDGYYVSSMLAWFTANAVTMHGFYDIFDTSIGYSGAVSFSSALTGIPASFFSNSPNAIATGMKTYTVPSALSLEVGIPLLLVDSAAPEINFLEATVSSYSGTSLVVNVFAAKGSGTPSLVRIETHPNAQMPSSLAAFQKYA